MRQIKFRVWDDITAQMHSPGDAKYCVTMVGCVCDDETDDGGKLENRSYRSTAMLSTGLKDKNGTEIYEGDILSWRHIDLGEVRSEVRWGNAQWNHMPDKSGANWGCLNRLNPEQARVEVIGNIHENPELLK